MWLTRKVGISKCKNIVQKKLQAHAASPALKHPVTKNASYAILYRWGGMVIYEVLFFFFFSFFSIFLALWLSRDYL